MSTDDMVFEDVAYREPSRLRRPDRDRRLAVIAYEVPGPTDLPIFIDRRPTDAIERHALSDTTVELGGILLGKECVDDETGEPFVWVTESLQAKNYENTQASFTYTHESWEEITRERDRLHPDLDIVGWYHTHPDFGIFLSGMDLFIHQHFFAQSLQVALVVDPIRQTRGFFQWRDGRLDQVGGYFLVADRTERITLSRLANDLEDIPNADGGGGGLSPRLEAELIAMLSRPHQPMTAAASPQAAAMFSLLGLIVGALGLAVWFWLQGMNQNIRVQTAELQSLVKELKLDREADDADRDLERIRAKESALDVLLREVQVGGPSERFTDLYTKAVQERDAARRKTSRLEAVNDEISSRLVALRSDRSSLKTELEASKKKNDDEFTDHRKTFAKQETELKKKSAKLDEATELLKGTAAETLSWKYNVAWFTAAGGWVVSLLLALFLAVVASRPSPNRRPDADPGNPRPPHSITG
ncbi:MAG: Mov34/MPN/PAD-1 family protein [Isosphaeraceae bacterium]